MEKNNIKSSFERMKQAVCEVVNEDLGVKVISCNSHTSCTLKVVALPEEKNTVEVYVPYQIFVGARTIDECSKWDVDCWKMGLRKLCFEFGVKNCPRTRLMTRKTANVSPRMYANHFWGKIESMNGWTIVLPEFPKAKVVGAEILKNAAQMSAENTAHEKLHNDADVQKAFEMLGLKFCCM